MQLLVQMLKYFQNKFKMVFDPKNMKKPPSKIAHNRPKFFFFYLFSMQLFSSDATIFSKKIFFLFFDHKKLKKPPSKIAHNRPKLFFSIANRPKTSPNINLCSIKIVHRVTYVMTLVQKLQNFKIKDQEKLKK